METTLSCPFFDMEIFFKKCKITQRRTILRNGQLLLSFVTVDLVKQLAEHLSICVDDQRSVVLRYATGSRAR